MRINRPAPIDVPALRRLWQDAFGDGEEFLDIFFSCGFSAERTRCVYDGDEVVAALYWFDCAYEGQRMAYLYAIATAAERRGQGLCRALMDDTHAHLASEGYAASLLVPAEPSLFDFYARMGYEVGGTVREISAVAGEEKIDLRHLEISEYDARRRALLPVGGVIQEGDSTRLLARTHLLLCGEDVLLAARYEKDTLVISEMLGNLSRIPAILGTLGCARGRVRTCGAERDFFMYYPLRTDAPVPTYLGIAHD